MTEQEQNATVGGLLREYKAVRENIACLRSRIEDAKDALAKIVGLLGQSDSDDELVNCLSFTNSRTVADVGKWLVDLHAAVRRKQTLKTRLDDLGYRDLLRP